MENHVQLDEALGLISCLTMEKKRSEKVLREDFPPSTKEAIEWREMEAEKLAGCSQNQAKGEGQWSRKEEGTRRHSWEPDLT